LSILRVLVLVLGALWFFPVSCSTGLIVGTSVMSRLDSRDLEKGQAPHPWFFAVAERGEGNSPVSVVPLNELSRFKSSSPHHSFLMPRQADQVKTSGLTQCSYRVISDTGTEQTIEVIWSDDDKTIWSRYRATRSDLFPVYSRMYHHGYMFQVLPFAVIFALVVLGVGKLLRKKLSHITAQRRAP
jgi:hypothetical protein